MVGATGFEPVKWSDSRTFSTRGLLVSVGVFVSLILMNYRLNISIVNGYPCSYRHPQHKIVCRSVSSCERVSDLCRIPKLAFLVSDCVRRRATMKPARQPFFDKRFARPQKPRASLGRRFISLRNLRQQHPRKAFFVARPILDVFASVAHL